MATKITMCYAIMNARHLQTNGKLRCGSGVELLLSYMSVCLLTDKRPLDVKGQ